ncbi:MAG: RNA-binding protein [Thaumarchaeota archaeon]|nr:RNA-binding protein [Nitrososphaerota archaeon]
MSFEHTVRIPKERIGVLIGRGGSVKEEIERRCGVSLDIDNVTGEVTVRLKGRLEEADPFLAVRIVTAIGRGFSPERAFRLLDETNTLEVIDLRDYVGKSENALRRIKGRIIGMKGKARRTIEELTNTYISVYGRTVAIIGDVDGISMAREAVEMLAEGREHATVYRHLERLRRKAKMERMGLWLKE